MNHVKSRILQQEETAGTSPLCGRELGGTGRKQLAGEG